MNRREWLVEEERGRKEEWRERKRKGGTMEENRKGDKSIDSKGRVIGKRVNSRV